MTAHEKELRDFLKGVTGYVGLTEWLLGWAERYATTIRQEAQAAQRETDALCASAEAQDCDGEGRGRTGIEAYQAACRHIAQAIRAGGEG